jgi:acetolactate synthase-1/2/3 large subunit
MESLTGGRALVRSLVAHGVTDLFGVPGIQSDWFYNALYDEGQPFKVFTARHEQGAAYMALGYAASTGRLGVLSVVPGPGLLNAAAALATANAMCAPVLAIVGQIPTPMIDRGHGLLHEIVDQPSLVAPFTRWSGRAASPNDVPQMVAEAVADIFTADRRPAYLEIPPDILQAEADVAIVDPIEPVQPAVDRALISAAAKALVGASNPMIVAGAGALDVGHLVQELAELVQAPVVTHRGGRGILRDEHPLSVSFRVARGMWADVDVVVAIGSRMQMVLGEWGSDATLTQIWVNADPAAAGRVGQADINFAARAEEVLPELLLELEDRTVASSGDSASMAGRTTAHLKEMASLEPQMSYLAAIRKSLGDDGILITDLTQVGYVTRAAYAVDSPRTYLYPSYMGTLGWAFPAALGAQVANPDRPVVATCGDGGFMFTSNELATAVQYGINSVTVVFDDSRFGNVQLMQRDFYDGRVHATDLTNPDFVAFAKSFGAHGELVDAGPDALGARIEANADRPGPTVLVVPQGDWPNPWKLLANTNVRP